MSDYIIETSNLTKKFGKFLAVDQVNLLVPKGGIYGFLGPNGAGKSTTIRMLLGLIKETKGEVKVFNKSIKDDRIAILSRIGSMVETPSYYGHLTAYENLEVTRKILGAEKKEIERVLEIVKLTEVRNKAVKKFSLGMKQRLGIAQALLGKPELLILDEPTNGLDPSGIIEIRELIKSLPKDYGITILISSHILSEIELMATHVGIINKGRLLFQGSMNDLREKQKEVIQLEAEPRAEVEAYLKNAGISFEADTNYLYLEPNYQAAKVNRELIMNGYDVHQLMMKKNSLEEIFLSITGKESVL
ncbi:ABC transporter ATP-binding protein [Niallia circulans]|uniref:Bacitracin ABC transporter ATP-binding protein n=1 Tax=Niallia circulans TaxID=1397 RepID=A0A0J1L978_NIACI|nr:ABC transporter ATP-binding protein [Niallia circulans]KLV25445.1 bacitracin ABC transporter ATP-binding protein [Niallia circulans]MDR4318194.1 ABC transporter ATP-binding protein [Niallia circulans]MED3837486.1 ABC transporter ATP-binding protein [Niallia circulans]MED4245019.1 ABC transporter ATP-binding protein [Niallia circulans]MED4247791.1 ABC transporter ATP-binding protein [Niallia circulans]